MDDMAGAVRVSGDAGAGDAGAGDAGATGPAGGGAGVGDAAAGEGDGMAGERPRLRELADRMGIVPEYVDQSGRERRVTSDRTRVLLLRAMGHEAETEADAAAALERLRAADADQLLPPTRVIRARELGAARVCLQLPPEATGHVAWLLSLETEDGGIAESTGDAESGARSVEVPLPATPGLGYHLLRAAVSWGDSRCEGEQRLIVVPDGCWLPDGADRWRTFGLIANLYTVRGERDWGIGNLRDLRELMEWGATLGADFVGVNPLHALFNRGTEISPYSPVSRLYRNPLYLDLTAIPELAHSADARAIIEGEELQRELETLRSGEHVQYERLARLERPVLEALHREFAQRHREGDTARGEEYAAYLEREGEPLLDFATFLAVDEVETARQGHPDWFRRWPEGLRSCGGDGIATFRMEHAELVDLHCWLQFELDRQLADAARAGRAAGMRLGLYQDLAIGSSGGGSDAWAYPHLLLHGVSIGAPPDLLGPQGQDWGLPPMDPVALAEDGYAYWIQLLRGAFRHAGALRIDHVLGLFRQFWIPWGEGARNGAYVRFPSEELLGILALESHRSQALVVGEDLGTVPPEVPPALARWQVLSSKVLYFEVGEDGAFNPRSSYEHLVLATANTHDMAPLAGYFTGRELELRADAGYSSEGELDAQLAERARTVRRLHERLTMEGLIPTPDSSTSDVGLRGAVHSFLRGTPAMLVGISLDDLAGEIEPVNMPGLGPAEFPSWTRRMRRTLEDLRADRVVREALGSGPGQVTGDREGS